uniref:Uncharacterized protein n=1 Tax=Arundo donax TaxID=35708 RepID=A0A0A9FLW3_ARUDO
MANSGPDSNGFQLFITFKQTCGCWEGGPWNSFLEEAGSSWQYEWKTYLSSENSRLWSNI